MLTLHLLVKVGFLDSNLLRMFGGSNEVGFGYSLARFKAMEVSYNFPRNSLLQKNAPIFCNSQNTPQRSKLPKINFFQNDLLANLTPFSILEFSKLVQIHAFKLHSLHYLSNHLQNTKPSKKSRNFKN